MDTAACARFVAHDVKGPLASGIGAGLAIARAIVERHDGALWIVDHDECRTSVAVTLPRAADLARGQ